MDWTHFVKPGLDSFCKTWTGAQWTGLICKTWTGLICKTWTGLICKTWTLQNILPNRVLHHDACNFSNTQGPK